MAKMSPLSYRELDTFQAIYFRRYPRQLIVFRHRRLRDGIVFLSDVQQVQPAQSLSHSVPGKQSQDKLRLSCRCLRNSHGSE
jgi:hypothetical protein